MIERVDAIWGDLEKIRQTGPLTGYISGYGVMNSIANMLLALGAAPKAVLVDEDADETVAVCASLFLTCEMARGAYMEEFEKIMTAAKQLHVPFVFDPAGVETTSFSTDMSVRLLNWGSPTVIRCNAAQILALKALFIPDGDADPAGGVAEEAARAISGHFDCVVVVTGEKSYIVKGDSVSPVLNGSPLMWRNADTSVFATAVCAAFCAVNPNPYQACINASFFLGICAEMATQNSDGPGTYAPQLLDAMANMMKPDILLK